MSETAHTMTVGTNKALAFALVQRSARLKMRLDKLAAFLAETNKQLGTLAHDYRDDAAVMCSSVEALMDGAEAMEREITVAALKYHAMVKALPPCCGAEDPLALLRRLMRGERP